MWDVEAQVTDALHTEDLVADLTQSIGTEEPTAWSDAQVRGVEAALLWELCQLAGYLLDVTARPPAACELWKELGESRLVTHRNVAGANGLVTARVWPAKPPGTGAEDEDGDGPVWGPGAVRDAGWRWSVGWDDPAGHRIDHEQHGGASQRAARWAAEQILGEVVADSAPPATARGHCASDTKPA